MIVPSCGTAWYGGQTTYKESAEVKLFPGYVKRDLK
jgi:hypothetical protein